MSCQKNAKCHFSLLSRTVVLSDLNAKLSILPSFTPSSFHVWNPLEKADFLFLFGVSDGIRGVRDVIALKQPQKGRREIPGDLAQALDSGQEPSLTGPGMRGAAEPESRALSPHRSPGSSSSSPQLMWPPPQTTRLSEQPGRWVGLLAIVPLSLAPSSPHSSRPQRLPLTLIYSWTGGSSASEPCGMVPEPRRKLVLARCGQVE